MTPRGTKDPEYPLDISKWGKRRDKRNLISEWQSMKKGKVTDLFIRKYPRFIATASGESKSCRMLKYQKNNLTLDLTRFLLKRIVWFVVQARDTHYCQ